MPSDLNLNDDQWCFACGVNNPIGLKLSFAMEGDEYVTYFTPSKEHQGWQGITHGGVISAVMDEVLARQIHEQGIKAVTGEMCVRYRKPAFVGTKIRFAGKINGIIGNSGRVISTSAVATDPDGAILAEATGKIVKVG